MGKKITLNNINNFLSGNIRMVASQLGILDEDKQEQVALRLLTCKDTCVKEGRCRICTCSLPNRAFSTESCNKELFPDLMNKDEWIKYKEENGLIDK